MQQLWAELSEKFADLVDPAIKYGGGDDKLKQLLADASEGIAEHETNEAQVLEMQRDVVTMLSTAGLTEVLRADIISLQEKLTRLQADLGAHREKGIKLFREVVQTVEEKFKAK